MQDRRTTGASCSAEDDPRRRTNDYEQLIAQLGDLFDDAASGPVAPERHAPRYSRALALLDSGPAAQTGPLAVLALAAELCLGSALELAARPEELRRLVTGACRLTGLPRWVLGNEALASPRLTSLPTLRAAETGLALLVACSDLRAAALYRRDADERMAMTAVAGEGGAAELELRSAARHLLTGAPDLAGGSLWLAGRHLAIRGRHGAALVVLGPDAGSEACETLLDAIAPLLTLLVERDSLLAAGREHRATDVAAAERRLTRLRFDLHDGPQQDVVLLAADLRLFANQFASIIDGSGYAEIARGRLDDLHARLTAIDGDLRRIAAFVESPFLRPEPFVQSVRKLVDTFAERSQAEPELTVRGEVPALSDSQQIALLGLIREALSNVREHSGARRATIELTARQREVAVRITDDGRGFEPEETLIRAEREGHLGLVGIRERIRLLGGRALIESCPGSGTVISASLVPWRAAPGEAGRSPSLEVEPGSPVGTVSPR